MNYRPLTEKWLTHFMRLSRSVSEISKDPSTKVGSVIIRPDRTIVSTGYNGFPRDCVDFDLDNKSTKYSRTIHAEMNAILTAREPLVGYTLFVWPMAPCDRCMAHIIQSGISTIASPSIDTSHPWAESCIKGRTLAQMCHRTLIYWNNYE